MCWFTFVAACFSGCIVLALRCRPRSPIDDVFVQNGLEWANNQPSFCGVFDVAAEFPPLAELMASVLQPQAPWVTPWCAASIVNRNLLLLWPICFCSQRLATVCRRWLLLKCYRPGGYSFENVAIHQPPNTISTPVTRLTAVR